MFVFACLAAFSLVATVDQDYQHGSFNEHYANGVSSMKQLQTQKGINNCNVINICISSTKEYNLYPSLYSELKTALNECLLVAEQFNDEAMSNQCYTSVFSSDYFWLK